MMIGRDSDTGSQSLISEEVRPPLPIGRNRLVGDGMDFGFDGSLIVGYKSFRSLFQSSNKYVTGTSNCALYLKLEGLLDGCDLRTGTVRIEHVAINANK